MKHPWAGLRRRAPVVAVIVGAAVTLSACVSAEHRAPQIAVPAAFDHVGATGESDALDRWWSLFGDRQLDALIDEALRHAPDAKTALAVLEEARAARVQSLTRFNVQGDVAAGAALRQTRTTGLPSADQGVFSGAIAPSWELDLFGRRAALRRAVDGDLDAARFQYEGTRQTLAGNVAGGLFEARANAVRLEQARFTLRIATDLARLGERRVAVGIGSRADAASLTADEATAEAAVKGFEVQVEIARRTLLILLGRGTDPVSTLPIDAVFDMPPAVPGTTPATLLVRRPDIRQAEARLRSAAGDLKLDALALLPTFNLLGQASYAPITGAGGLTTSIWSIGAGLALPLLDRPRLLAEVRGQRARTEQAVIAYENAVQAGFGEAQNALSLYAADKTRLVALARAEERARFAFDAQRAGYQAGVVDLATLLQAERIWRTNLAALSDLRAQMLTDAVNLFRALGGGWPATGAAAATMTNDVEARP